MVRDSVDGASAAIEAAAASRVRKVVLTSSIVTLPLVNAGAPAPTEDDWRDDLSVPYYRAKTLGEREAWRLASERNVKLVTVLPGFVLGPPFLRRTTSLDIVYGMMLGVLRFGTLDVHLATPVDVRDVARAHILAATRESNGRFIVANDRTYSYLELSRIMHSIDPAIPRAPFVLPNAAARAVNMFENARRAARLYYGSRASNRWPAEHRVQPAREGRAGLDSRNSFRTVVAGNDGGIEELRRRTFLKNRLSFRCNFTTTGPSRAARSVAHEICNAPVKGCGLHDREGMASLADNPERCRSGLFSEDLRAGPGHKYVVARRRNEHRTPQFMNPVRGIEFD
jgi:hypothetical protein